MTRSAWGTARSVLVFVAATLLVTCARETAGPGRRAALSVVPVLPAGTNLAAFNLVIDGVRVIVVDPPADTVFDKTYPFPASETGLQLQADIPLDQSRQTFRVTIRLLSGATVLFEGTQDVTLSSGSSNPSRQIPVTYAGPGQNVATLTIDPVDSVLSFGAAFTFRPSARDNQGNLVSSFYLSWTTSDTLVAPIDATGRLVAPNVRGGVMVSARTPNNVSASTPITFAPVATALSIVSGCGQSAPVGTQLAQPIVARVVAADGLGVKGVLVTFTAPAGASVTTPQVMTDAAGLAQTLVTLGPTSGPTLFQVSAAGLGTVPCSPTALGTPARLAFAVPAITAQVGVPISPAVVVGIEDTFGNLVSTATDMVTIAIGANPGMAVLGGTTNVAAVGGLATFSSITLDQPGIGYTLVATSGTLTAATSTSFDVVALGSILGEVRDAVTNTLIMTTTVRLGPVAGTFNRQVTTGVDGSFRFDGVAPGMYQAEAAAAGYVANTAANVRIVNAVGGNLARADFALPPTSATQRFGSLSGRVFDQNSTPLGAATVTISGGSQTNGVFRAATSRNDGTYALTGIVLDDVNSVPITSFTVAASGPNYAPSARTVTLVQNQTVTNTDFQLGPAPPVTVFFADDFESTLAWTTSGFWNRNALVGLQNTAYPTYVDLAPDDGSGGALPTPAAGAFSLWYGQPASGNFLGQQDATDVAKSGGTSVAANIGSVVSPQFVVTASAPRATLRFDTWFEIESQNPNANGFDIMSIAVQDVGTGAITVLGRLNPFEDPTFFPRAATPYTSAGFNRAPVWRPVFVDLSAFRGMVIRLVLNFDTVDQQYNGFRGWIVDNVQVSDQIPGAAASLRLAPAASTGLHLRTP